MLIEEILKGESEKIEFKENAKTNTYIKTVVAFANGNGGKLVFGEFGLTRMGGSQDEMTKELQFLDLLKNNKSVKLSGGTLTLISNEGIELVFKDPKAVNTEAK